MATERDLSVFVDESGSFDSSIAPSRFYLISLVFHDQGKSCENLVSELETQLEHIGFPGMCVHSGPLIRREGSFSSMDLTTRRKIFGRIVAFARRAPVHYHAVRVDKCFCDTPTAMSNALEKQISEYLSTTAQFHSDFSRIKIYYDNGQHQVAEILKRAFASTNAAFEVNVTPNRYRLFQVADLVCTIELLKAKLDANVPLTKSELYFFNSIRELKKNYIRPLAKLRR